MKKLSMLVVAIMALSVFVAAVPGNGAGNAADAIWNDGTIYDVTATPALINGNAPAHTMDTLYKFPDNPEQRAISDAAPGDTDYNGGRWLVRNVEFTPLGMSVLDGDLNGEIDVEIMDDATLHDYEDLGYLTISDPTEGIVCPLHKSTTSA